jgi:hypothetical protein
MPNVDQLLDAQTMGVVGLLRGAMRNAAGSNEQHDEARGDRLHGNSFRVTPQYTTDARLVDSHKESRMIQVSELISYNAKFGLETAVL